MQNDRKIVLRLGKNKFISKKWFLLADNEENFNKSAIITEALRYYITENKYLTIGQVYVDKAFMMGSLNNVQHRHISIANDTVISWLEQHKEKGAKPGVLILKILEKSIKLCNNEDDSRILSIYDLILEDKQNHSPDMTVLTPNKNNTDVIKEQDDFVNSKFENSILLKEEKVKSEEKPIASKKTRENHSLQNKFPSYTKLNLKTH